MDYQVGGINYLNTNPDGTRTIMTPNHAATVSQGAVTTYDMINGSGSPTAAAYNTAQANIQNGLNMQAQVAKQVAAEHAQIANQEKTALDALNKRLTAQAQLLRANASQQNAATRAATAGNNGDSQAARTMLATLKALPDGDPRKAKIMQALTDMYVSPTSPTE